VPTFAGKKLIIITYIHCREEGKVEEEIMRHSSTNLSQVTNREQTEVLALFVFGHNHRGMLLASFYLSYYHWNISLPCWFWFYFHGYYLTFVA